MTKPSKESMETARGIVSMFSDHSISPSMKRLLITSIAAALDAERAHSAKLAGELDVMRSRVSAHLILSEGE